MDVMMITIAFKPAKLQELQVVVYLVLTAVELGLPIIISIRAFMAPSSSNPVGTSTCASGYLYKGLNCYCTLESQCSTSVCSTRFGYSPGNICSCNSDGDCPIRVIIRLIISTIISILRIMALVEIAIIHSSTHPTTVKGYGSMCLGI